MTTVLGRGSSSPATSDPEIPRFLDGAQRPGPIHQVTPDAVLVDFPGLARILVRDGAVAGVEAAPDCDPEDLAWLIDGHVSQIAALQRGEIALRASAVVIDGRAIALCGRAAVGASALAAGLASRGHPVLADGWLPVTTPGLLARAVTDELALWPDVAAMIGLDHDRGRAVRTGLAKRRHRFARGETVALGAVVLVERYDWEDDFDADRARGGSALEQLYPLVAHGHLVEPMGLEPQRFWWAATLAAGCHVHRVELGKGCAGVEEPARAIEAMVRR